MGKRVVPNGKVVQPLAKRMSTEPPARIQILSACAATPERHDQPSIPSHLLIDGESLLLAHEEREVEREAVGVIHLEGVVARQHSASRQLEAVLLQLLDALLERAAAGEATAGQDGGQSEVCVLCGGGWVG